jgi:hypothetical protein
LVQVSHAKNADQAWDIAKTVFRWSGTDAIEEYQAQSYMLPGSGMHLVSYGAGMGVGVEASGQEQNRVTVDTN